MYILKMSLSFYHGSILCFAPQAGTFALTATIPSTLFLEANPSLSESDLGGACCWTDLLRWTDAEVRFAEGRSPNWVVPRLLPRYPIANGIEDIAMDVCEVERGG